MNINKKKFVLFKHIFFKKYFFFKNSFSLKKNKNKNNLSNGRQIETAGLAKKVDKYLSQINEFYNFY